MGRRLQGPAGGRRRSGVLTHRRGRPPKAVRRPIFGRALGRGREPADDRAAQGQRRNRSLCPRNADRHRRDDRLLPRLALPHRPPPRLARFDPVVAGLAGGRRGPLPDARSLTVEGELLLRDDREPVGFEWSKIRSVTRSDLGIRFVFGTGIALIAAVSGMVVGPKFGGLFLAFPAILPASLTLIEKKEGTTKAWADASGG